MAKQTSPHAAGEWATCSTGGSESLFVWAGIWSLAPIALHTANIRLLDVPMTDSRWFLPWLKRLRVPGPREHRSVLRFRLPGWSDYGLGERSWP
jgi:hypothetical protein